MKKVGKRFFFLSFFLYLCKNKKMTKEEILGLVRSSHEVDEKLPLSLIEKLTGLKILQLALDGDDPSILVYKVPIDGIIESDIKPEDLFDRGWEVSKDETYIYKIADK